jgi:hypothetical protein
MGCSGKVAERVSVAFAEVLELAWAFCATSRQWR